MLQAYKKNYRDLNNKYQNLNIPNYQREYVWSKIEWEDFYNDLKNIVKYNFKSHFMGTLLVKKNTSGRYDIIDGQQRLITINIFLMAYRDFYLNKYSNRRVKYISNSLSNRIKLTDTDNTYELLYNSLYNESTIIETNQSKNILKAYQFFRKVLEDKDKTLFGHIYTDNKVLRILLKLIFIVIEIDNKTSPYLIFETLNARGVDLNISDLVKNHLLDRLKTNEELSNLLSSEWAKLNKGISANKFENIFQAYYKSSMNRKAILKEITKTTNTEEDIKKFVHQLSSYINTYKILSDANAEYWNSNKDLKKYILNLHYFECTHILKILYIPIHENFKNKNQIKSFKFLESLVFRYIIICRKDESKIIDRFYEIARKLNSKEIDKPSQLKIHLLEFIIDDEEFEYSFAYRSIEYPKNNVVQYILYTLENYLLGTETYILKTSDASVEHIEADSTSNHNLKYRLGNYTLLTEYENGKSQDKSFVIKKENYYKNSGFALTNGAPNSEVKPLNNYTGWNLENIKIRQSQLATLAVKVWKI